MLRQLLIGGFVISLTIVIHAVILDILSRHLKGMGDFLRCFFHRHLHDLGMIVLIVLGIMFAHMVEVFLWALTLLWVGALDRLEPALYFSLSCFTTLGFGDIILSPDWRLLSALIGADGFLIFGWSAAYMVRMMSQLRGYF